MPWGAILSVGSSLLGGFLNDNASSNAADSQAQATADSNATQRYFYDTTRSDNMPALQARNNALARMQQILGVGADNGSGGYGSANGTVSAQDVMNTPGYQFGLDQGITALNRQAAARGSYNSGAALKAASRYGTDYATTKYQDAFNNLQTQQTNALNRLAQVAGYGTTGANTVASSGANAANNISANQTALGNALGAAQLSNATNWGNTANQIASAWNRPSSNISMGNLLAANASSDPIYSLGSSQNWWS